ncbi:PhnD/SsuA/transferrin family substrate-binding protein [Paracoccus sp. S-4012]|uniref:ABC transporter substrate-binding protein n=1 Tax=Paracoccus sp. S-4012 TaxID=2665648 RepID=UPI0012B02A2A|nr:MqnA/MqnD/SBP family protein [Paracoccus sp. S-4012]MRX50431.1 PhnD/SsuA/transferrin family substrate-binding protein [Paracoccus sp. S-4012]
MIRFAAAAAFLLAGAGAAFAQAKTITFSHLANPSHEAALYAIEQGIVTSDKIKVEVTALDIAALQQAIAARTFDVVEGAAMAVPRANARGLDLQIIGIAQRAHEEGLGSTIWVKPDSPIQTAEDLKGKRVGGYTLSSAGMTLVRIALNQAHGLDVSPEGGDLQFVELPESALAAALAAGNVDASVLIHAQAYEAMKSGEFRPVVQLGKDMTEKFGLRTITSVLVAYGDKLTEDPESYQEFLRMFRESVDYALANQEEVFTAVGEQEDIDPEFFTTWFTKFTSIPVYISQNDLDAIDMLWTEATKLGVLDVPHTTAIEATWDGAVFEGVEGR